jgi:hypothetical protein
MITIKQEQFYYRVPDKDGNPGDFKSFNVAGERRLSELKKEIEEKVDDYMDVYLEEFKKTIVNLEDNKVDKITTINGKDLSRDRILYMNDIPVSTSDSRGTKTYTDKIVNDEAARATKKEGELSTAISAETTRATEAEATLQTNKADKATTINGKDLSKSITLYMNDIPVSTSDSTGTKTYTDAEISKAKNDLLGEASEDFNTLKKLEDSIKAETTRATTKESEIDADIDDLKKYTDDQISETKTYADNAANTVKNDLLNGAGEAYDTLLELGELIDNNTDAIDALNKLAATKTDKTTTVNSKALGQNIVISMNDIPVSDSDNTTSKNYVDTEISNLKSYANTEISSEYKRATQKESEIDAAIELLDTNKMDKENPVGTGSFSLNRKDKSTVGDYSVTTGLNNTASGKYSVAHGSNSSASADYSYVEGYSCFATKSCAHAEGWNTKANGYYSHSEGYITSANGDYSHTEGESTKASSKHQHVQGKHNIEDTSNKYAHIVGNGTLNAPSNAHTLDWNGNAWFAGNVYVGGTSNDDTDAKKLVITDDLATKVDKAEGYSLVADTEIERLAEIGTMLSTGSNGEFAVSDGNGGIEWIKEEAITLDEIKLLFDDSIGTFTWSGAYSGSSQFEIGMTWEEYVNSEYNTAGFVIIGSAVGLGVYQVANDKTGMGRPSSTDEIVIRDYFILVEPV